MSQSTRKLAGTLLLVAFVVVYVLAAMLVAAAVLPRAGRIAEFAYYLVAGLAWVPAAGLIVSWMHRTGKPGSSSNQ